ncbi:hypothetical protein LTQ57_04315 [Mycobacterium avium subsp. avium]|uniref:hypothetical protein n=1 Tax=Mycobacterium avium TaxID=1764 RepID=UPI0004176616|nr:hypothetical protein [Mycobacterium avium]UGU14175.1 hypothetical protein LTQ57_04315 [Mycobacterium avium subsp. avium]
MPNPEPQSAASMPSWALTSAAGVSPRVAMPSMSVGARPASATAARTASMVSSRPGMPVRRPIREIPMPDRIASFSKCAMHTARQTTPSPRRTN